MFPPLFHDRVFVGGPCLPYSLAVRNLRHRYIPPGAPCPGRRLRIRFDDYDAGALRTSRLFERTFQVGQGRYLTGFRTQAGRMSGEVDLRRRGEQIVERLATGTFLQAVNATEAAV